MSLVPNSRPQIKRYALVALIKKAYPKETANGLPDFLIVGYPAYYRDSMGANGKNDRGIFDDAVFLLTPNTFAAFNGNTDPSAFREGIATLQPGWYPVYQFSIHGGASAQYPAICQRKGPVIVRRDGTDYVKEGVSDRRGYCLGGGLWRGEFGINIHRGGRNGTSSLGCQTIPPAQWDAFYTLAKSEAVRLYDKKWNTVPVTYCLLPYQD